MVTFLIGLLLFGLKDCAPLRLVNEIN